MRNLVVTADDLGLCAEIDDAILLLHDRGVVTRASLLVNGPRFEDCVGELRRRPHLDLAAHLNLTDGVPILSPDAVPSLVGADGCFSGGSHYRVIAGVVSGRVRRSDVLAEWHAQLATLRDTGLRIQELNAHGHLHLLPHLHRIVVALRREFQIPRVRLVRSHEGLKGAALHWCSRMLRRRLEANGVSCEGPARTVGLRVPGDVDPRIDLATLAAAQDGVTELIVHPASGRNAYHQQWHYSGERVTEWLLASASDLAS